MQVISHSMDSETKFVYWKTEYPQVIFKVNIFTQQECHVWCDFWSANVRALIAGGFTLKK